MFIKTVRHGELKQKFRQVKLALVLSAERGLLKSQGGINIFYTYIYQKRMLV